MANGLGEADVAAAITDLARAARNRKAPDTSDTPPNVKEVGKDSIQTENEAKAKQVAGQRAGYLGYAKQLGYVNDVVLSGSDIVIKQWIYTEGATKAEYAKMLGKKVDELTEAEVMKVEMGEIMPPRLRQGSDEKLADQSKQIAALKKQVEGLKRDVANAKAGKAADATSTDDMGDAG